MAGLAGGASAKGGHFSCRCGGGRGDNRCQNEGVHDLDSLLCRSCYGSWYSGRGYQCSGMLIMVNVAQFLISNICRIARHLKYNPYEGSTDLLLLASLQKTSKTSGGSFTVNHHLIILTLILLPKKSVNIFNLFLTISCS